MNFKTARKIPFIGAALLVLAAGCAKKSEAPAQESPAEPVAAEAASAEEVQSALPAGDIAPQDDAAPLPEALFADDDVLIESHGKSLRYKDAVRIMKRMMLSRGAPADMVDRYVLEMAPRALPEISEQFAITEALKADAEKGGFKCEESDVANAFSNLLSRLPEGITLDEALRKMGGTTKEEAEKEIREGMPVSKLLESLTKGCEPGEEAVRAFYDGNPRFFEQPEQVKASHILVKFEGTNETEKAEARAKTEGLLAKIKEGGDFAQIAKENSDCPSKEQGGDLGFFGRGQMVPEFEETAFGLATNEVSGIVQTRFGFHIIKLLERKDKSVIPFDEVKDSIAMKLESDEKNKIVGEYIESVRERIVKDGLFKANPKLAVFVKEEEPCTDEECKEDHAKVESEAVEIKTQEEAPAGESKTEAGEAKVEAPSAAPAAEPKAEAAEAKPEPAAGAPKPDEPKAKAEPEAAAEE